MFNLIKVYKYSLYLKEETYSVIIFWDQICPACWLPGKHGPDNICSKKLLFGSDNTKIGLLAIFARTLLAISFTSCKKIGTGLLHDRHYVRALP